MTCLFKSSQRTWFLGQAKNLASTLIGASVVISASGCTQKKKDTPTASGKALDANSGSAGGFELQDLKPLSGSLLRIVDDQATAAPTIGNALLVSDSVAIAVGFSCRTSNLHLVFQAQGDDLVENSSSIKGETRRIAKCESSRSILEKKITEAAAGSGGAGSDSSSHTSNHTGAAVSETLGELKKILDKYPKFEVAKLSFEGGIPAVGSPKWAEIGAFNSALKLDSKSETFSAWQTLSGKFVALAGFAKDTTGSQGPISKRVWLPFRVGDRIEGESELVFSLQAWFSEGERSPFKKFADWLEGPDKVLHPAMAFAGVTRYPNVRPFTEIQTVSPSTLCFVIQWDENKETAENLKFSARCVDAAPFISLLK